MLKTFGLMQLIPHEMETDLIKLRQQLTNYARCRNWVMDQVATRAKVSRAELNGVQQQDDTVLCAPGESPPSNEELMAFWNSKGGPKGKGKHGSNFGWLWDGRVV